MPKLSRLKGKMHQCKGADKCSCSPSCIKDKSVQVNKYVVQHVMFMCM